MASHRREPEGRMDADGVRIHPSAAGRRLLWLAGIAIGLPVVCTLLAVVVLRLRGGTAAPTATAGPTAAVAAPEGAGAAGAAGGSENRLAIAIRASERTVAPRRRAAANPAPAESPAAVPAPEIDAADAIALLRSEGETGGIAAFGIPGTDPPKAGVIVPDDFPLPEGFVRHHQTTDDGEQLPAILMVHPDYELVDARGNPVATPDRVVPPELAPPGLPIRMLEVPERRTRTTDPESGFP